MTRIQLIVPLEDDRDNTNNARSCIRMSQMAAVDAATAPDEPLAEEKNCNSAMDESSNPSSSTVLSQELREQFESMKTVWRQSKRAQSDEKFSQGGVASSQEDLRRKARETAVETALAVDEELSRWKNGIAELEAMLAAEEDSSIESADDYAQGEIIEEEEHRGEQGQHREASIRLHRHAPEQHPRLGFPDLTPIVQNEDDEQDGVSSQSYGS